MKTGAKTRTRRWLLLTMSSFLLFASGCSLGLPAAEVAAPAFEGAPQIHIASPLPDQTFLAGATVIVQARIENAGPDLARISILLDGTVLGERLNPNPSGAAVIPLTMDWPTSSAGQFQFAVEAVRANGELARETVSIAVVAQPGTEHSPGPAESAAVVGQPGQTSSDGAAPFVPTPHIPRATEATTDASPRIAQATVRAVITVPSNLRLGPGTEFELVGSIAVGEEVDIIGVNSGRDWYHIRYGDVGDAWIYAELLSPSGDVAALNVESGPARPTAIAEAAPPASAINLKIVEIILQPDPLVCNERGEVLVRIENDGAESTPNGAQVGFTMVHVASGSNSLRNNIDPHPFQPVAAGEIVTSVPAAIMSSVYFEEEHRITATIRSEGFFVETDLSDNSSSRTFRLASGNC